MLALYALPCVLLAALLALAIRSSTRRVRGKGPPGHWLLGNIDFLAKGKLHENFVAGVAKYGPLFPIRVLQRRLWILSHPESITRLLKGGASVAVKPPEAYFCFNNMTQPSSISIISAKDDDKYFKVVRTAAAQVFSMKSLRALFPGIVGTAAEAYHTSFAAAEASGAPAHVDVDALFLRVTVDVLGHLIRGRGFGACSGGPCRELEVVEHQCQVVAGYLKNPFRHYFFWDKEAMQEVQYNREFDAMVRRFIADLRASTPPAHTLGSHLLALKDPHTGGEFPELRLRAELSLFLMAGFETTAHSAAIALFAIIAHPEVEARVCTELDALGLLATAARPTPRSLQWEDLGRLRVLSAAVQESLRWLPAVATGTIRVLTQAAEICGEALPKGSTVWVPNMAVHRSPHNWERSDEYDIGRWLTSTDSTAHGEGTDGVDSVTAGMASRGFLPFSEGPRNCVGQALARVEMLVSLALLLGSYHVELAPEMGGRQGVLKQLDVRLALRPMDGLWCRVQPRVPA